MGETQFAAAKCSGTSRTNSTTVRTTTFSNWKMRSPPPAGFFQFQQATTSGSFRLRIDAGLSHPPGQHDDPSAQAVAQTRPESARRKQQRNQQQPVASPPLIRQRGVAIQMEGRGSSPTLSSSCSCSSGGGDRWGWRTSAAAGPLDWWPVTSTNSTRRNRKTMRSNYSSNGVSPGGSTRSEGSSSGCCGFCRSNTILLANHTSFLLTQTDRRSGAAAAGCTLATRPTRIVRLHIFAASRWWAVLGWNQRWRRL